MFKILISDAACPEVVHSAPTPPSSAAIFFSTISTVGLEIREYMCPSTARSTAGRYVRLTGSCKLSLINRHSLRFAVFGRISFVQAFGFYFHLRPSFHPKFHKTVYPKNPGCAIPLNKKNPFPFLMQEQPPFDFQMREVGLHTTA